MAGSILKLRDAGHELPAALVLWSPWSDITESGDKSIYLSVSFAKVEGVVNCRKVVIERPIEIFIPSSQTDVPQEWISSFSRQLSLNARSGFLSKALQDARQVKSDRGRERIQKVFAAWREGSGEQQAEQCGGAGGFHIER